MPQNDLIVLSPLIGGFSICFCIFTLLCFLKDTPNFANFFKVSWFAKIYFLQKKQQLVASFKNLQILRASKSSIKKLQNLNDEVTKTRASIKEGQLLLRRWKQEGHGFHVITSSPWPLFIGICVPVFFGVLATTGFARNLFKISYSGKKTDYLIDILPGVKSNWTQFTEVFFSSSKSFSSTFNFLVYSPIYAFIIGTFFFFITIGYSLGLAIFKANYSNFVCITKEVIGVDFFSIDLLINFFVKLFYGFSIIINQYFLILDKYYMEAFYTVNPNSFYWTRAWDAFLLNQNPNLYYDRFNFIGDIVMLIAFCITLYMVFNWIFDLMDESNGIHTKDVRSNIFNGFMLFVLSEVMVFFGIFWSYFYYKISPSDTIGGIFPPLGIDVPDALGIALANTVLLLTSGMSVNLSLKAVQGGKSILSIVYMVVTLILGSIFLALQFEEYKMAGFQFADSIFGSIFYFTTGAHGFHVFLGAVMLFVSLLCLIKNKVNSDQNLSLILPIIYWHFVDVVWIVVFFVYYYFV